jgi:hypothetical protein
MWDPPGFIFPLKVDPSTNSKHNKAFPRDTATGQDKAERDTQKYKHRTKENTRG